MISVILVLLDRSLVSFELTLSTVWKWKSLSHVQLFVTPLDYRVHGSLQARTLEWLAIPLLQGIFPTRRLNPGLWHCRWIPYQLSHYGDPKLIKIPQAVDAPLSLSCNNFSKSFILLLLCLCCSSLPNPAKDEHFYKGLFEPLPSEDRVIYDLLWAFTMLCSQPTSID